MTQYQVIQALPMHLEVELNKFRAMGFTLHSFQLAVLQGENGKETHIVVAVMEKP